MSQGFNYQELSDQALTRLLREKFTGVIVFASDWTGGASLMHTMMERLSGQYAEGLQFFHMDPHKNPGSSESFGINGHLAILFFKAGEVVDRVSGIAPKQVLRSKVEQLL